MLNSGFATRDQKLNLILACAFSFFRLQLFLCLRVDESAAPFPQGARTTKVLSGVMPRSLSNPTVAAQPKPAVKAKDRDPVASGLRDAAQNRSASHNYALTDRYEAGVALRGTEVKSIREGKANLKDAYGLLKDGECFLLNAHIGPFSHGNQMNHESLRTRRLLLHKTELRKLEVAARQKGFTLIPTRLYFRKGRVKCEIALAKGKQEWDKRAAERKREADGEARAAIARSQRH
jgi:SsrA-binding protein